MTSLLLKHEFLRTKGLLAAIFGIDLLVALVGFVLAASGLPVVSTLGNASLTLATASLVMVVMFGLGYEHWRSSFTGRGYLTHSLPLRGRTQAAVSLLHAYLWTLAAALVSVGLGLLAWLARGLAQGVPLRAFREEVGSFLSYLGRELPPAALAAVAIVVLISLLGYLAMIWFSVAVGSEGSRAGTGWGPVVVYVMVYILLQAVMALAMVAVPLVVNLGGEDHLRVHAANVLELMSSRSESMMPLGFLLVLLVMPLPLTWRTMKSWDEKVSLA